MLDMCDVIRNFNLLAKKASYDPVEQSNYDKSKTNDEHELIYQMMNNLDEGIGVFRKNGIPTTFVNIKDIDIINFLKPYYRLFENIYFSREYLGEEIYNITKPSATFNNKSFLYYTISELITLSLHEIGINEVECIKEDKGVFYVTIPHEKKNLGTRFKNRVFSTMNKIYEILPVKNKIIDLYLKDRPANIKFYIIL